jgi:hypothetical protein
VLFSRRNFIFHRLDETTSGRDFPLVLTKVSLSKKQAAEPHFFFINHRAAFVSAEFLVVPRCLASWILAATGKPPRISFPLSENDRRDCLRKSIIKGSREVERTAGAIMMEQRAAVYV